MSACFEIPRGRAAASGEDSPILWVISGLGYLYCVDCADRLAIGGRPIRLGAVSFGSDTCDQCGKAVGNTACGEVAA